MTKYKVYISIDGNDFFWVIIENGIVTNRNATREELTKITTKTYYYNKTNICPICRKENNITDKSILYPGHAYTKRYTKEIVCSKHYQGNDYNKLCDNIGPIELVDDSDIKRWTKTKKHNKEELIEFLRNFEIEEGRSPREEDFINNPNYPSFGTYVNYFGSFTNAKREAGLSNVKKCKIRVSIDGKNFFWIIVENGKLIKNPNDKALKGAIEKTYNETNICPRCREEYEIGELSELIDNSFLYPGNARKCEIFKNGNKIRIWNCTKHRERYDLNSTNNARKSVGDRRTGNQDPSSNNAKGDKGEYLLCAYKGYTNLNKKHDNYNTRRDCLDEKTGEYYQAKVAFYNSENKRWSINFRNLQDSISIGYRFRILYIFCISEDGQTVERGYEIPEKEVINRGGINIYKNPIWLWHEPWYEPYRIKRRI